MRPWKYPRYPLKLSAENAGGGRSNVWEHAPEVVMDPSLASNALAGRRRIAIRPTAQFNDKDVDQLIQHEAFVHVATSINGHLQPYLKILVEGHAGTTATQEGLAVFAEFITGNIDLDRLRRLSDRVIAIQHAIDGADFIDVYRYFLEKTDHPERSFQNAKRVFRGGVMTGGAPFTRISSISKDWLMSTISCAWRWLRASSITWICCLSAS